MNSKIILIAGIGVAVLVAVLVTAAVIIEKRARERKAGSLFVAKKTRSGAVIRFFYRLLDRFILTRPLIRRLEKQLRPLYASTDKNTMAPGYIKALGRLMLVTCISWLLPYATIYTLKPSAFTFISALFIAYVLMTQLNQAVVNNEEMKFFEAFNDFLNEVKHHYLQFSSVRDAVYNTMISGNVQMQANAKEIYDVLTAEDGYTAKREYINGTHHEYLKLFVSLAGSVEEYGDTEDKDNSTFLKSVMQLRSKTTEDKRFMAEKKHRYMALGFVAALPAITIPYIAAWGVSTLPALSFFYYGLNGKLISYALLIMCFICYIVIMMLQDDGAGRQNMWLATKLSNTPLFRAVARRLMSRNQTRAAKLQETISRMGENYNVVALYIQKVLIAALMCFFSYVIILSGHNENRALIVTDTSNIETLSDEADARTVTCMTEIVPQYTAAILKGEEVYRSEDALATHIYENDMNIRSESIALICAQEIYRRVDTYKAEGFNVTDILVMIIYAFMGYAYPTIMLKLRAKTIESRMQGEVAQFQSIINLLSKVPGVTAITILETMEDFASIFKSSIQQCINEFNINDMEALERLYNSEPYPEFRHIVDNFMMIDEVGIERAFDEIETEMVTFKDDKRLTRQINLDNEVTLATLIAVIPVVVILIGYLLAPFLVKSLNMFNEYQNMLSTAY